MSVFLGYLGCLLLPSCGELPDLSVKEIYRLCNGLAKKHAEIIPCLTRQGLSQYLLADHEFGINLRWLGDKLCDGSVTRLSDPKFWRKRIISLADSAREHRAMINGSIGAGKSIYCSAASLELVEERESIARENALRFLELNRSKCLVDKFIEPGKSREHRVNEIYLFALAMEALAKRKGMECFMLTLCCPPEYHSNPVNGHNSYKGSSPRRAHDFLQGFLEKIIVFLSANFELNSDFFGLRITELHQDGCPHWHVVLFCKSGVKDILMGKLDRLYSKDSRWPKGHFEAHKEKIVRALNDGVGEIPLVGRTPSFLPYVFKNFFFRDSGGEQDALAFEGDRKRIKVALNAAGARAWSLIGMVGVLGKLRLVKKSLRDDSATADIRAMASRLVVCKRDPDYKRKQLDALVDFIDRDVWNLSVIKEDVVNRHGESRCECVGIRINHRKALRSLFCNNSGVVNNTSRYRGEVEQVGGEVLSYPIGRLPSLKIGRGRGACSLRHIRAPPSVGASETRAQR